MIMGYRDEVLALVVVAAGMPISVVMAIFGRILGGLWSD